MNNFKTPKSKKAMKILIINKKKIYNLKIYFLVNNNSRLITNQKKKIYYLLNNNQNY